MTGIKVLLESRILAQMLIATTKNPTFTGMHFLLSKISSTKELLQKQQ